MKIRMCLTRLALAVFAMTWVSAVQQAGPRLTGGNGTLYIGGYPNVIWIIDEATEKVVGTIQTKTGIPRRLTLSRDLKRFYNIDATNEHVEIIDIASRATVDSFRLTEGNKRVRIASLEPDPQHRYLMMITKSATKLRDRVEIGPSQLQQFDLKERKVTQDRAMARRSGTRPGEPDVLARRQAAVLPRRTRSSSSKPKSSRWSTSGICRTSRKASAR